MSNDDPQSFADLVEKYDGLAHESNDPADALVYATLAGAWATMELAVATREHTAAVTGKPAKRKPEPGTCGCGHAETMHWLGTDCRSRGCPCKMFRPELDA